MDAIWHLHRIVTIIGRGVNTPLIARLAQHNCNFHRFSVRRLATVLCLMSMTAGR